MESLKKLVEATKAMGLSVGNYNQLLSSGVAASLRPKRSKGHKNPMLIMFGTPLLDGYFVTNVRRFSRHGFLVSVIRGGVVATEKNYRSRTPVAAYTKALMDSRR